MKGHLAIKVKELRNQKGLSQEALAEDSGLSLRTIQRIENGESNPMGDTLKRLAHALNVNPDELIDWSIKEDNRYLVFLNLSALSFLFFPLLGILIPFIMWTSQKDHTMHVDRIGRALINFEINWTLLFFLIPFTWFVLNMVGLTGSLTFSGIIVITLIMYVINVLVLVVNAIRISNRKEESYFSLIRFLK